jgi:hypothetical protein
MSRYGNVTGSEYRHGDLAGISAADNTHYLNNQHLLNTNISTAFWQYSRSRIVLLRRIALAERLSYSLLKRVTWVLQ